MHSPRDDTWSVAYRHREAPPTTAEELALEAVAANGWRPAQSHRIGGWLLRASGGHTQRANSILPLRPPGLPLDEAITAARSWYAERGLPVIFQVPTESRRLLDAELGERGWDFSPDVHVMTAPAAEPGERRAPAETAVTIAPAPDEGWYARYRNGAGASPDARSLLTRHDRAGFAAVRDAAGSVIAIGRGALDEGPDGVLWLGIFAVEVDPAHRRLGLALAITAALHRWGATQGARQAYLQVETTNDAAVGLYERLGYVVHHDYRYRRDPAADGATGGC